MKLTTKILIGILCGLAAGVGLQSAPAGLAQPLVQYALQPIGDLFLRAIKMLVVPLVFFSVISGTANVANPKTLGRIGAKTLALYLITTALAITLALIAANLTDPGTGVPLDRQQAGNVEIKEAPPVTQTLLSIIPTNPIDALANGDMLPIIAFALFVGLAMASLGERVQLLRDACEQANVVMMRLVDAVMKLAPYGAFALMAVAITKAGLDLIGSMFVYLLTVIGTLLIHAGVVYSLMVRYLGKMSPRTFFRGMLPAMEVAFATSSSSATLPVTMEQVERELRVPKSVSSFVLPVGATMNMDGTAIMMGVASVFIAQAYGVDLTLWQQATIVLTATLASIGTAAVPSAGLVMLTMVLTAVGLPVEGIALVMGVDRLVDMCRTVVNITGDACVAVCVASGEAEAEPLAVDRELPA
ncbi:dicarboxylate/amino acid:cation symporter [Calditerricola satsumensis]|uniref:Sodium:dicarboxylate symporter n=1 Tax=Calditerricola satsumensis TaxID=373054 RepID=A0A8J3B3P5_9BACI|nr:dicarboxylate/amino acid:cation symporter [Calditerricola satsumensis]GGJ91104.1 sodium:dicarboxylate symporter [Calditerricola satsumensis]